MLAFLDCSKCYDRVGRAKAAERAMQRVTPHEIANMVLDMYGGQRHANHMERSHKHVQGYAFAKDKFKPFLGEFKRTCADGRPRDHMGDITLQVGDDMADGCGCRIKQAFGTLKEAHTGDNMALNDSKQPSPRADEARQDGLGNYGW